MSDFRYDPDDFPGSDADVDLAPSGDGAPGGPRAVLRRTPFVEPVALTTERVEADYPWRGDVLRVTNGRPRFLRKFDTDTRLSDLVSRHAFEAGEYVLRPATGGDEVPFSIDALSVDAKPVAAPAVPVVAERDDFDERRLRRQIEALTEDLGDERGAHKRTREHFQRLIEQAEQKAAMWRDNADALAARVQAMQTDEGKGKRELEKDLRQMSENLTLEKVEVARLTAELDRAQAERDDALDELDALRKSEALANAANDPMSALLAFLPSLLGGKGGEAIPPIAAQQSVSVGDTPEPQPAATQPVAAAAPPQPPATPPASPKVAFVAALQSQNVIPRLLQGEEGLAEWFKEQTGALDAQKQGFSTNDYASLAYSTCSIAWELGFDAAAVAAALGALLPDAARVPMETMGADAATTFVTKMLPAAHTRDDKTDAMLAAAVAHLFAP